MITYDSSKYIVHSYREYIVDCDSFFIINLPVELKFIISDDDYDLMRELAESYIADEFSFAFQ